MSIGADDPGDTAPSDSETTALATEPSPEVDSGAPAETPQPTSRIAALALALPLDDADLAHRADPLIGLVVAGRYRILTPIGRGGMGVVYKVEHVHLGKLLAMKLLAGELSMSPEVVRRFKREALTVSRLSSPSTVHVFDYGVDAGLTYIVMELVTGRDLAAVLADGGPMPFARLGKIVLQILSSLGEAHGKGIVHRDVKPQNVMITTTEGGTDIAKVLDFGIAKLREEADASAGGEVTRRDQLIGTPYFLAPELIRGDPVDHRADLYAVGVLLYHALTGHYPFHAKTSASILVKHVTETAIAPSIRAPSRGIPPGVDAVVLRALEKEPAARWQSAGELQAAIAAELRKLGTEDIEALLDASVLRNLTRAAMAEGVKSPGEIASRDEVEAYERKLRSRRHLAWFASSLLLVLGTGAGLFVMWRRWTPSFAGAEIEPNDTAANATPLPLGAPVSGLLGKRIDAQRSDRDFYSFEIPKGAGDGPQIARFLVTALPNMETCTLLYRQGFQAPIAQYCVGRPGRDLSIPRLSIEPGRYYASVLQDLDPRGDRKIPFVHENVSDTYSISIALAEESSPHEIEPNEELPSATPIEPGETRTGALGWIEDQDTYCVGAGANGKAIRWTARDVVRDPGTVLEVTTMRGRELDARVRVHTTGEGAFSQEDSRSPWTGPAIAYEEGTPRCVRVKLVRDPWNAEAPRLQPGGPEAYVLAVDVVP
ncbi:serine/threonine-protein kinase [Polyangium sp. y55x31]|uniref:serine/threonine-protein kinase n=1 Tax=Polyangium sp. y55x31 TaxID=3042688 RepID=UPI002482E931|nr:serine/threonine-protein kinase [Polyangium sp. y55x31]MDI1475270.1 serine/threonine-protein kinase [Polyangium sp. y55x31]